MCPLVSDITYTDLHHHLELQHRDSTSPCCDCIKSIIKISTLNISLQGPFCNDRAACSTMHTAINVLIIHWNIVLFLQKIVNLWHVAPMTKFLYNHNYKITILLNTVCFITTTIIKTNHILHRTQMEINKKYILLRLY